MCYNLSDRKTARSYLRAAGVLHRSKNYDAAAYLCGYAVEIVLKARICQTLRWKSFPATAGEFQKFRSLQTHDLEALIQLSGVENRIKPALAVYWSTVEKWRPEQRYDSVGTQTAASVQTMIEAAKQILKVLI